MIYLSEILSDLSHGEFANMAISNPMDGSGLPDQQPRLVALINTGLLALYSRFKLKEKEFDLYQRADKILYYIRSTYMGDPNAGDDEIYIDGTGDTPPAGDIIRFLEAYDADGEEVHINNPRFPDEIQTMEQDIIRMVPDNDDLKIISIKYQASHAKIASDATPATTEIHLPPLLKKALLAHIAIDVFTGKDNKSAEKGSLANSYFYRYENLCNQAKLLGLFPDKDSEDTHFENNGWV